MPLVSIEGEPGAQAVKFWSPGGAEKQRKTLKWVLRILIVTSAYSVLMLFANILPVFDFAFALEEEVLADPGSFLPEDRDIVRLLSGIAALAVFATMGLLFYIPGRYFMLHRRLASGHPAIYVALRRLAILQLIVEAVKFFAISIVSADLETMTMDYGGSINLFLAPTMLFLLRNPEVKRFYSVYKLEQSAGPGWQTNDSWSTVGPTEDDVHAREPTPDA